MNQEGKKIAYIDADLEEIIPIFFENLREEIRELQEAFAQGSYETVKRLGHSIKGSSLGYGFEELGKIGLAIEKSAGDEEGRQELSGLIDDLVYYADTVQIEYK